MDDLSRWPKRPGQRTGLIRWIMRQRSDRVRPDSEDGDTLLEVLVAIVVVALAGVALLGAFAVAIGGSATHRSLTTLNTVLQSFAEEATFQIQLQPPPLLPLYEACATASGVSTAGGASWVSYGNSSLQPLNLYSPPANYTVKITGIANWNGTAFIPYMIGATNNGTCSSLPEAPQLITATATGPKGITSSLDFVVANPNAGKFFSPGVATHLVFVNQPGGAVVNQPFTSQPAIAVEDANGSVVTTSSTVTLSITPPTGASGASLSCTSNSLAATNGIATFSGCAIDTLGTGYTLTARDSGSGITPAPSSSFDVTATPANPLVGIPNPTHGPVGTSVTISGVGFQANSPVTIKVGTYGAAITSGTSTNASGSVTATFTVPPSASGIYPISISDGTKSANSSSLFTVDSVLSVSPASGAVGTTGVTLTGSGYSAGATVDASTGVTFAGSALTISATQTVSARGGWSATFTVPSSPGGAQTVTASDSDGASASTSFTVDTTLAIPQWNPTNGDHAGSFSGNGGTANSTVTVTVCSTNNFPSCASIETVTAVVQSDGTWTTGQTGKITKGTTYFAQAVQDSPSKTSTVLSFVA